MNRVRNKVMVQVKGQIYLKRMCLFIIKGLKGMEKDKYERHKEIFCYDNNKYSYKKGFRNYDRE